MKGINLLNDKVNQQNELPRVACGSWATDICGYIVYYINITMKIGKESVYNYVK